MIKKNTSAKRATHADLFRSVTRLIEQSRQRVLSAFNTELVSLYWNVGNIIRKDILQNKRAGYGEQVVAALSKQLTKTHGKGWGEKQLNHCIRSAETFSQKQIVYAVRRQLSWTHLRTLMFTEDPVTGGIQYKANGVVEVPETIGLGATIDESWLGRMEKALI